MVEVVIFPKLCPKCRSIMRTVKEVYISFYQCVNAKCGETCCHMRR